MKKRNTYSHPPMSTKTLVQLKTEFAAAPAKMKTSYWLTDDGKLITDPAKHGFKEMDCGPDMLCKEDSTAGYCDRVVKFRACFVAVDGPYTKLADTLEGAIGWRISAGCDGEGFVSQDGIVRFTGIQIAIKVSFGRKVWSTIDEKTLSTI
jgi:hypothetical protein